LLFGLATVLGLAPRGFFIPYRYAGSVPPAGERAPYGAMETLFSHAEADFARRLEGLGDYAGAFRAISEAAASSSVPAPRWEQDWFPRLDAAMAYAMVRNSTPRRIIEVGSGHSTRFLARAVADGGADSRIIAIDPAPRAAIAGLGVEIIAATVQDAGTAPFEGLAAGDILFIDSSHILMPGSDVDFLINRVLPGLPGGVLVHIHDIFLPEDYPLPWAWRGYNEQLAVAALLIGGAYRVLFSSRYATTHMAEAVARSAAGGLPLVDGALESSLWLEKL
jgi:predicted O-methyltransferase YrrM